MSTDRTRLREKLCRELAQSEHDAQQHTRREAGRLGGDIAPARALLAIADHADEIAPRITALVGSRQSIGLRLGRAVGVVFSGLRHFLFDRLIDTERSYRGTLLGLRHGVDVVRLLREVALLDADVPLIQLCDILLVDRQCLLEDAEQALAWFAENPGTARRSGASLLVAGVEDRAGVPAQ